MLIDYMKKKRRAFERRSAQRSALRAVERFPMVGQRSAHPLPGPLVISLTSYAKRFATLHLTLRSLLDQTVAADQIALWVSPDDHDALPDAVKLLTLDGVSIRKTKDIRSYTKLVPALHAFPEAFILTADDDIYYPPTWVETIVNAAMNAPGSVIARRAHMAVVSRSGETLPYTRWGHAVTDEADAGAGLAILPTGVGGVLYPPRVLGDEVFNEQAFLDICPYADDLWFFWMELIGGVGRYRVGEARKFVAWPSTQETGLLNENLHLGRNDTQRAAIEKRYGALEQFVGRSAIEE